jgi:hypothetical protein
LCAYCSGTHTGFSKAISNPSVGENAWIEIDQIVAAPITGTGNDSVITAVNGCLFSLFNNKFSSPANSMQMFNALDTIRTYCSHVIEVIQCSMKINESANNLSEDVDPVEAQEAYDEHRRQITYILDKEINKIIIGLKYIKSVIEYDLTKIMLGVDFITEYKKRLKRIPRDKDLLSQINIHYKILTPGDRKFIEKEKCRNAK